MKLQKRDYVALAVGISVLVITLSIVIGSGFSFNPFTPKAYVKLTGGVDCFAGFCWFNEDVKMEYSMSKQGMSVIPRMAWWCGPMGGAKDLEATLTVECPDLSIKEYHKEQGTCEDKDIDFFFTVPLDRGYGTYKITGKICGDTSVWGWKCVEKTGTLNYVG